MTRNTSADSSLLKVVEDHTSSRQPAGPDFVRINARPVGAFMLIGIVLVGLLAFGVWSVNAMIDELARARGQVIAAERTQVIQAADNGVLAALFVAEGESVEKGALLALLDQSRALAAYEDSRNKVAALRATLARLHAEVFGRRVIDFPAELQDWPSFVANQQALFERRQRALRESIQALERSIVLVSRELEITEPLLAAGDVGQAEVIRLQRQLAELQGQVVNTRNKYFQDAQADMTRAEEELAAQEQLLRERAVVLGHTELRAPMDAVIRKINITTLGASVRPGDVVMEMLPGGGELIVEAKFPPADVASLRVGLPVSIKLDAYDASIFGDLQGEVIYISPDALEEPQQRQGGDLAVYYRVLIRMDPPPTEAGSRSEPIFVNPGMTALVEVRTRERSVFSYLTKPVTKTLSSAMRER